MRCGPTHAGSVANARKWLSVALNGHDRTRPVRHGMHRQLGYVAFGVLGVKPQPVVEAPG